MLTIRQIESKEAGIFYIPWRHAKHRDRDYNPTTCRYILFFGTLDLSMPTPTSLSHLLHPDYHAVILHLSTPSVPSFPLAHLFCVITTFPLFPLVNLLCPLFPLVNLLCPLFPLANHLCPLFQLANLLCPSFSLAQLLVPLILTCSNPCAPHFHFLNSCAPPSHLFTSCATRSYLFTSCTPRSHWLPSLTEHRQETFLGPLGFGEASSVPGYFKVNLPQSNYRFVFLLYIYFSIRCMVVMKVFANGSFLGPTIKM